MISLQASTSYGVGFAISSFPALPRNSPNRRVILAKAEPSEKSVEIMRKFSEQYARRSNTYFCVDKGVTSVVIKVLNERGFLLRDFDETMFEHPVKSSYEITGYLSGDQKKLNVSAGLAEHRDTLGAPLCPCRHYDDKTAEAQQGFWNCPCVPMRERKECHCMLFLTPDNDFAGNDQTITMEEIKETTANI